MKARTLALMVVGAVLISLFAVVLCQGTYSPYAQCIPILVSRTMSIAEFKSSKHELLSFTHLLSIGIKESLTFKGKLN